MRLLRLLPVLLAPIALAQTENFNKYQNPFTIPRSGFSFKAGEASDIEWSPTTNGTVSIILRSGPSSNFGHGEIIASHISNTGTYTWTPSTSITLGLNYVLEIVNDDNLEQTNYSPYFVINSPNTVVSSTAILTYAAETSVQSLTSAYPTEVVVGEVGGTATSVGPAASITSTGGVPGSKTPSATSGLTAASSVTVESANSSATSGLSTVVSSAQGSLAGFVATTSSRAGASVPTGTSGKRVAIVVADRKSVV